MPLSTTLGVSPPSKKFEVDFKAFKNPDKWNQNLYLFVSTFVDGRLVIIVPLQNSIFTW